MEPTLPVEEGWILKHWIPRKVPRHNLSQLEILIISYFVYIFFCLSCTLQVCSAWHCRLNRWIFTEGGGNTRPPDLPLEKLYAGREATVRTGHGTTDCFQIGKRVRQGCMLSLCWFNLYAEHIMRNAGMEEAQAGIKIAGRNINDLRCADDTTLMAESEEDWRASWGKWKRRVKKVA